MAAALKPQVSHLTTPAREGPTRELVCLPSGVPTEEHHEERPRGGGQELCRWPRGGSSGLGPGREGLGAGSVVCWELEGSSQGWGRHTIPLPAGSPELHNSSRRGWLYTMGKENWREDPSFCPRSLFCCRLLPARLLSELALRILPRDQNLNRSLPPETRKHSHHVHFALLLWTGAIPLGFQSGNASTWRPHGLAWPRL